MILLPPLNSNLKADHWLPTPGYDLLEAAKNTALQIYSANPNRLAAQGVPDGLSAYGIYICIGHSEYNTIQYIDVFGSLGIWSQNGKKWLRYNSWTEKTLVKAAVTNSSGIAIVDISALSDTVISSAKGVIATLNGQWGSAGVLNASLDKPNKTVIIATNAGGGYALGFAISLI